MSYLYEADGQTASQLAKAVGRANTSFTPILDGLQAKGWIERQHNLADRRSVMIHLTEREKALQEEVNASTERIESKIRQQISDQDQQGYERVVAMLQDLE